MKYIILILLIIGVTLVTISWMKAELKCPAPKIVYKYIPKHQLDVQFGNENNPGEVFFDMFTKSSPTQGGYHLGAKDYIVLKDGRKQKLSDMFKYSFSPSGV